MGKLSRTPVHKMIRSDRPNGKAHKKGFSYTLRRLVTTNVLKGMSFNEG
jgi:hypothetical protein